MIGGLGLMSLIDHTTPLWHLGTYMDVFGLGTGMLMQNLVLVVQNTVVPWVWQCWAPSSLRRSRTLSPLDWPGLGCRRARVTEANLDLGHLPGSVLHAVRTRTPMPPARSS